MQVEKVAAITMGFGEQQKCCVFNSVSPEQSQAPKGSVYFSTGTWHQEMQFLITVHDEDIMTLLEIFLSSLPRKIVEHKLLSCNSYLPTLLACTEFVSFKWLLGEQRAETGLTLVAYLLLNPFSSITSGGRFQSLCSQVGALTEKTIHRCKLGQHFLMVFLSGRISGSEKSLT